MDLADLIADLILEHNEVENGPRSEKLMQLQKVFSVFDKVKTSPKANIPNISAMPPPQNIPQKPGPPYLPTNYLPPHSFINSPPETNHKSLY